MGERYIRVQHCQARSDHHTAAPELAEDVAHHGLIALDLRMEPRVANGQPHLLQHVEDDRQLLVRVRFAAETLIEHSDSQQRMPVHDGNRDLRSE